MNLTVLILGGTSFLGPHLFEELKRHGHEVTLFNRGNQNVDYLIFVLFQKLLKIH